ncbi:MAG: M28 family metallopeptidase [Chthoniobacterales bacterium]
MTICNASSELSACPKASKRGSCASGAIRDWRVRSSHANRARSARSTFVFLALLIVAGCDQAATRSQGAAQKKIWDEFSGEKALAHVQAMVDFGPRPPATDAIEKTRVYLTKQLEQSGWKVQRQPFSNDTPRGKVDFVNLIATYGTGASPSFLVCSHYDTKTFDNARFVGANDGGSSTGILVELARVLAANPDLARKIELVFFDGEEAYEAFTDTDGLYGSRYFAADLVAQDKVKLFRGAVLLDMVGDKSLTITLPPDSPAILARDIFAAAEALKLREHFTYFDRDITDDHTPLNEAGIPAIDLIDFDYPPWHTPADTIDKLSAESLRITGAVTAYYLSEFAVR